MLDPLRLDFLTWSNGDYTEEFTVKDGSTPVDLSDHSFVIHVKLSPSAPTPLFSLVTVGSEVEGIYPSELSAGKIQIRIDRETLLAAATDAYDAGVQGDVVALVYDMIVSTPSGANELWFYGFMYVNRGITNV